MGCEERDQDLLMMAHGELSWSARLRLTVHLLHCVNCRERYAQFVAVSSALARAIRDPAPLSSPGRRNPLLPKGAGVPWLSLIALGVLLILLGWIAVQTAGRLIHGNYADSSLHNRSDVGCRPDLPNDHCR